MSKEDSMDKVFLQGLNVTCDKLVNEAREECENQLTSLNISMLWLSLIVWDWEPPSKCALSLALDIY